MHIHGQIANVQTSNLYAVANGERAQAARRAAEVRKRLLRAGQDGPDGLSDEERLLIGHWMEEGHSPVLPGGEDRPTDAGRGPNSG